MLDFHFILSIIVDEGSDKAPQTKGETPMKYLDKMVDYILTGHCIKTGYADDGIEAIYKMADGTKYRILLNADYEVVKVNVA